MHLIDHIAANIPLLKGSDTLEVADELLLENKISNLAYVDLDNNVWLINENSIENFDIETTISDILQKPWPALLAEDMGLFDALNLFIRADTDALPLVASNGKYLGLILKSDLLKIFLNGLSLDKNGAIIEIKGKDTEFSIAEISRIIEQEHAHILSLFLFQDGDSLEKSLIIKLDTPQISYIIVSLERFGYEVLSYYSTEQVSNLEKDRYELLMKYLNI